MDFYLISVVTTIKEYSYGTLDSKKVTKKTVQLEECDDFRGLVIKDGIIVGVLLNSIHGEARACLPGQEITTYWASDDDGTGSTDREDTCCLICV